jgi:nucleoside-diphosphate-sugar epimerase
MTDTRLTATRPTRIRCLLIGAAGFLGRHVRAGLAETPGVDLMISVRSAAGGAGRIGLRLDLANDGSARVARLLDDVRPDVIVNCAGTTGGDSSALVAGNVVAVSTLVEAMQRTAPGARLVHLGSAAEYGRTAPGTAVAEWARPDPVAPYGVTKLAATELVRSAVNRAGLDAVVLRVFNPVGPDAPVATLPGRLVAELRRAREHGGDVRVGSLAAHRDFVDVRDVASAVAAAAVHRGPLPFLLNVGSGRATSLRDLATAALAVSGSDARILEAGAGSARSADVPWQQADVTAARRALGWTPEHHLDGSLRAMWQGAECLT